MHQLLSHPISNFAFRMSRSCLRIFWIDASRWLRKWNGINERVEVMVWVSGRRLNYCLCNDRLRAAHLRIASESYSVFGFTNYRQHILRKETTKRWYITGLVFDFGSFLVHFTLHHRHRHRHQRHQYQQNEDTHRESEIEEEIGRRETKRSSL